VEDRVKKIASYVVGIGLSALVMSGCTAPSLVDRHDPESDVTHGDNVGRDPGLPLTKVATPAMPADSAGAQSGAAADVPADASDPADEEFWTLNQAPLGTAAAAIEERFPNDFAYAFFDDASAMHVAFAGRAPADAATLLQSTGLPFVLVESVGFTYAEYQAAGEDLSEQTVQYVTAERQVSVSLDPTVVPGALIVSFQSTDSALTVDPGLVSPVAGSGYEPVAIDPPFTLLFDDENTSPAIFGIGSDKVGPSIAEQRALAPGETWSAPATDETVPDHSEPSVD
jgi:hypothetical protein